MIDYRKRERETIDQMDLARFSNDKELIHQVQKSHEYRANGRIYDEEQGLKYLQNKSRNLKVNKTNNAIGRELPSMN